jgi:hypothetical protein
MKKLIAIITLISATSLLQGCSHGFTERSAPCPPTASLSSNPCDPLPINIASSTTDELLKKIIG